MKLRTASSIAVLLLVASCATGEGAVTPDDPTIVSSTDLSGWFRPLPFHRILDIQQATLFYPDVIGLCLQIDPVWFMGLEGCIGGFFIETTLHLDLRLPVFHYIRLSDDLLLDGSHRIHGWELGIGPIAGIRDVVVIGLLSSGSTFTAADSGVSVEGVYWFTKRIGLKMQLDVGAILGLGGLAAPKEPFIESKIGVAF